MKIRINTLRTMASGISVISAAGGGRGEFLRGGKNTLIFGKENSKVHARNTIENDSNLNRYIDDFESYIKEVNDK